jgi:hypothetical protein
MNAVTVCRNGMLIKFIMPNNTGSISFDGKASREKWLELADACEKIKTAYLDWHLNDGEAFIHVYNGVVKFYIANYENNGGVSEHNIPRLQCIDVFREAADIIRG